MEPQLPSQKHLSKQSHALHDLVISLIAFIDKNGYLSIPLCDVLYKLSQPVPLERLRKALAIIKSFHPPGVGAESLEDCLMLQLDETRVDSHLLRELISKHLPDIREKDIARIQTATGYDELAIKDAVEVLKTLHPQPGRLIT